MRLGEAGKRESGRKKMEPLDRAIEERDGPTCFFCGDPFDEDEHRRTREHLVPVTAGGPTHISNLFHAGHRCNVQADALSVPEKLALRDRLRARAAPKINRPADGLIYWHVPGITYTVNHDHALAGATNGETDGEKVEGCGA